jgi:hypothetical protein
LRERPDSVHILVCKARIYVYSSLSSNLTLTDIIHFYRYIEFNNQKDNCKNIFTNIVMNYSSLLENFLDSNVSNQQKKFIFFSLFITKNWEEVGQKLYETVRYIYGEKIKKNLITGRFTSVFPEYPDNNFL